MPSPAQPSPARLAALAVLSLTFAAPPALAADGVVPATGEGSNDAAACYSAKEDAPRMVNLALTLSNERRPARVTSFGDCRCSYQPEFLNNPAAARRLWRCTVDAEYSFIVPERAPPVNSGVIQVGP